MIKKHRDIMGISCIKVIRTNHYIIIEIKQRIEKFNRIEFFLPQNRQNIQGKSKKIILTTF